MIRELFLSDFPLSSCVWQSTIFIVVGLVGSFILRHRSSRAHQVLFLAMIAAVIVPIMSILVKHYELGMFVAEPIAIQSPAEDWATASNYGAPGIISAENIEHNRSTFERDLTSATTGSEIAKFPWRSVVLCGWIAASLILFARLLVTFVLGVRILGQALPLDYQRIKEALHLARAKLGIDKDVSIRSSRGVHSPVIWCWRRRPVLLVPSSAGRFDNRLDWAGVLCHELAHWKRRDHISGLLAELVVCILPWHPLLWWAKSRLVKLSEQACDDWVVATGRPSTDYAESLLDLTPGGQMAFVPAVVRSKKGLAGRIRRILKDNCGNPRTGATWALAVSIVAACLTIGVACAQTRPAKPQVATEHEAKYNESLIKAAADGDIEQVKSLISKGADVSAKDKLGRTALHYASEKGHREVAKLLISHGAYVNATSFDARKPLHYAAMRGDKQTVELLLSKGADINAKDRYGSPPLFEAMKSSAAGHKEVVELLFAKGAKIPAFHLAAYLGDIEKLKKCLQDGIDINSQEDFGSTVLHLATNLGKKDIVEFLISRGAQVDAKDTIGVTPLYYAAMHNYEDIADLLLAKGADANAKDKDGYYTLLYYAIWDSSKDAIKLLISKGANVNVKDDYDYTPLVYAIWEDDKDMVELLISKGADVNAVDKDGLTPYYWAAMQGRKDLVELLTAKGAAPESTIHLAARAGDLAKVKSFIEEGTDVNARDKGGETPLFSAVLADNSDVAKFLITKGADVNAKDGGGVTPLNFVIRSRGKKDMVELLISKGADVNAKNERGVTPLHSAIVRGQKDVAELLIVKGANLNAEITGGPAVGWTPLHFAAGSGQAEIAVLLISKGADINARENNNQTPLHVACLRGHKDAAELLIAKGADINAKDNKERTALSLAKEQGHDDIVELLRKHGAKE
ncbi:MAG: ankyrin repeat domain-containing protein [Phycisphaerae bacterium]